ncbi:MAG: hypothetical protein RBS57_13280 [Desulforhabdus sp.]|jgi:hypothetical protein|nr:hypothetical protein [Desulforhabdus sp.]
MARIIYCHPSQTKYSYHIYTDLDFWDARHLLKDLATVKRNFGKSPSGDEFPTQVVGLNVSPSAVRQIEKRLKKAIISPPRHVVARAMVYSGAYEFVPLEYYPKRWSKSRMMFFTRHRLPLQQSSLSNPYQTVKLTWVDDRIRVERVQRERKYDPVIRNRKEAKAHVIIPSCF